MTDQPFALPSARRAAGEAHRRLEACNSRHRMLHRTKPIPSLALAACIAAVSLVGIGLAQAKQPCSVAAGSRGYWSWRIIDGRKCWYEGKPMLSKSLLEWPAQTSAQPDSSRDLAGSASAKPGNPLDAEAYAPDDSDTFEALWHNRIENH